MGSNIASAGTGGRFCSEGEKIELLHANDNIPDCLICHLAIIWCEGGWLSVCMCVYVCM